MLNSVNSIFAAARGVEKGVVAVAAAHDEDVLRAVVSARREGIADALLIGDAARIRGLLHDLNESESYYIIEEADGEQSCAQKAVEAVRSGRAGFLMKGLLNTTELLRAVVNKEAGLSTGRLLSHVMLYEVPAYHKLLYVTDGGMNPAPDLLKKADILENAAVLLKALGYGQIYASCLCGSETVSEKIPATVDASALSQMHECWRPYNMAVIGPVGFDLAISQKSCEHKGYSALGAGDADILLCPNYETGNAMGKAFTYFGGARSAGLVVGARVPIILTSRSDTSETKLASIALGKAAAHNMAR